MSPSSCSFKNNFDISDSRIKIIEIEKTGDNEKCAGLVRNIGMKYVNNSSWIGFLDDDDYLGQNYIYNLKTEILLNDSISVCIFRMGYESGCILPSKYDRNIYRGKVGISFAMKKHISETNTFKNNPFEDYIFLKELQNKKYKILISSFVSYFVRTMPYECDLYPKILIKE